LWGCRIKGSGVWAGGDGELKMRGVETGNPKNGGGGGKRPKKWWGEDG